MKNNALHYFRVTFCYLSWACLFILITENPKVIFLATVMDFLKHQNFWLCGLSMDGQKMEYIYIYIYILSKIINATLLFLPPFFMSWT